MFKPIFPIGTMLHHIANVSDDASPGVVTGILYRPHGILYCVTWGDSREESQHYEHELSVIKKTVV